MKLAVVTDCCIDWNENVIQRYKMMLMMILSVACACVCEIKLIKEIDNIPNDRNWATFVFGAFFGFHHHVTYRNESSSSADIGNAT